MDYRKYYTPIDIADILLKQLNVTPPESIIDICCGSFNLLNSAKRLWPKANLVGVDIDIDEHFSSYIKCIKSDGRKFALNHNKRYPLILANPPFNFVNKKREFLDLYNDIPFEYCTSRLENEMFLANLHLLDENGTLMIIMPSTLVNAKSNIKIRKYISSSYYLKNIFRLPDDTFGSSMIKSYALIIKNTRNNHFDTEIFDVVNKKNKYAISNHKFISKDKIDEGQWDLHFSYDILNTMIDCRRGTVSSNSFVNAGIPILHSAKINNDWKPSIRYVNNSISSNVYAEDGDIIVNRVGKAAGQWSIYKGKPVLISDCLFRIKDPNGYIAKKIIGHRYSLPLKGVATRYITKDDFAAWYGSIH